MTELLYFKSQHCSPCAKFLPVVEGVSKQLNVRLVVLDVADHQLKAMKYQINSLPTMIVEKDGIVKDSLIGAMSRFSLEKRVKNILGRG